MNIQPTEILQKVFCPENGTGVVSYIDSENQSFGVWFPGGKQMIYSMFDNLLAFAASAPVFEYRVGQLVWVMPDHVLIQCQVVKRSLSEYHNGAAQTYMLVGKDGKSIDHVPESSVYKSIDQWVKGNCITFDPSKSPDEFYFLH